MPIHKDINLNFFEKWTADMAYVLGFFWADGSMFTSKRGAKYLAFYSNDRCILQKLKSVMQSGHKISSRKSVDGTTRYTLQIGSKRMWSALYNLDCAENKSLQLQFPNVPKKYLRDFVRGYFDGDGNVLFRNYFRKDRLKWQVHLGCKFSSGTESFLKDLRQVLSDHAGLGKGSLYAATRSYVLSYSMKDSKKLFAFMYKNAKSILRLDRKFNVFRKAMQEIDNTER